MKGSAWRSSGGKLLFGSERRRKRADKRAAAVAVGRHPSGDKKRCRLCNKWFYRTEKQNYSTWETRTLCSDKCRSEFRKSRAKSYYSGKADIEYAPKKVLIGDENGTPIYRVGRGEGVLDI